MFCCCRSTKLFYFSKIKKNTKKKLFSMASIVSTAVEHPNVYDGTKRTGMWSGSRKVHDVIKKYQAFLMRSLLHVFVINKQTQRFYDVSQVEPWRCCWEWHCCDPLRSSKGGSAHHQQFNNNIATVYSFYEFFSKDFFIEHSTTYFASRCASFSRNWNQKIKNLFTILILNI